MYSIPITPIIEEPGKVEPMDCSSDRYQALVVDDEADTREVVGEILKRSGHDVYEASTIGKCRELMSHQVIDLVLLDINLPDGSGLEYLAEIGEKYPAVKVIVIAGCATVSDTIDAMRGGVADVVTKPFDNDELIERVDAVLTSRHDEAKRIDRFDRLKRLCKKLNKARHEIAQQVDILCNELVNAYQELANQMQSLELTYEMRSLMDQELDLEQLLRNVLEFLLDKIGPMNAVVFLPGYDDDYTVGGYVNYSCDRESTQFLLQHLADVVAPGIAEENGVIHLTDNESLLTWVGDDAAWLEDSHVIAVPCRDDDELLASIMLFRDNEEPFREGDVELLDAFRNMFGEHLAKVIHVHHRTKHMFGPDDDDGDDDGWLIA